MNTFRRQAVLLCALLALIPTRPSYATPPTYTLVDLGALNTRGSDAYAISPTGAIVGMTAVGTSPVFPDSHGFLWSNGRMTDLGTLGGDKSQAQAINGIGQVAGSSVLGGSYFGHACLWNGAATPPTNLGTLGGDTSIGNGLNDSGVVVGASRTKPGSSIMHAFSWRLGNMTDLGTLGGMNSGAVAINGGGEIVGYSQTTAQIYHAVLWKNGHMTDLGTLGGASAAAHAINAAGVIVGDSIVDAAGNHRHAFLWNGAMQDLAPFNSNYSSARDINTMGDIVGFAQSPTGAYRGFLYEQGTTYDLNDLLSPQPAATVTYAYGINDAGEICGVALVNGAPHAVLLTPTTVAPTVATAASATPNPVTGKMTTLSAFGSDPGAGGEPTLTYIWAETSGPSGVTFSANGTNTARNSKATFTQAGAYTFAVTIANKFGQTVTSSVNVTVDHTATSIIVTPGPTLTLGSPLPQAQQFTASALDQFGDPLSPQPAVAWSIASGSVGSISDADGLYHSGSVAGTATVRAKTGGIMGTCAVVVN